MDKKGQKRRLDIVLVDRGMESSRARAQARILAGDVVVDDHRVDKPGHLVAESALIRLKKDSLPFVSRGGFKLEAALQNWPGPVSGAVCIDVGASTGGFTDVLLQHEAKMVFAVDVGYNQLAFSLRQDSRVVVFERTHIVHVPVGTFLPAPTIAVVDVSFISLERVLPQLLLHLAEEAYLYILIKPQFEVGPRWVEKGGIVRDEKIREAARDRILHFAANLGFKLIGFCQSPITGADGNIEYIAGFKRNK